MGLFLGVDTSNYSTSVALYDTNGEKTVSLRRLLPVKEGQIGLRQSDALFLHTKALPDVFDELPDFDKPIAIGVSTRPRNRDDSYMPCFLAGVSVASAMAKALNVPLFTFSHQDGHILSALYSSKKLELVNQKFIAFHVSGGTTEALLVSPDKEKIINCEIIAETTDLNAGQAVDRVGAMLGLSFPSGVELDKLARQNTEKVKLNIKPYKGKISFSGLENQCKQLLEKGFKPSYIADYCIKYIEKTLSYLTDDLINKYGDLPLLFSGGVMSNSYIQQEFKNKYGAFFATPQFSSDNALGVAILASMRNNND